MGPGMVGARQSQERMALGGARVAQWEHMVRGRGAQVAGRGHMVPAGGAKVAGGAAAGDGKGAGGAGEESD